MPEEQHLGYPITDMRRKLKLQTERDVLSHFEGYPLDDSIREYLNFHANRYAFLLAKLEPLERKRILDIGPSFQTLLMREIYPESVVDTLGFDDSRFPRRETDRHIEFDLNDSTGPEKWPKVEEPYDLVVMAEVLEHVYTAARPVLNCVASLLREGGTLVIQTPNAVNLGRRISTAKGQNPFGMIREQKNNPGHFCEFTVNDLRGAAESAGLTVVETTLTNYFGSRGFRKSVYEALCSTLPGELRDGITLIAKVGQAVPPDVFSGRPEAITARK
jgi:SAM-dependent methyltransferase